MKWPPAHPRAREEFDHTVAYFRERVSRSLARRFTKVAIATVLRARQFPESGSPIGKDARRMQLKPFKYDMIYLPDFEGDIFIVAYAHHRQRPGYWRARL